MNESFFANAPVLSWTQWIPRRLGFYSSIEPSRISSNLSILEAELPKSPTGVPPKQLRSNYAAEYVHFLATYFYPTSSSIQLCIPAQILVNGIQQGHVLGIEIRSSDATLVGFVCSQYAGMYKNTPIGTITMLCVHPNWRRKGVTNCLLRWIYSVASQNANYPRSIFCFRNDGWLQSIVPPIWSEVRMIRKRRRNFIQQKLSKVPYTKWYNQIVQVWKQSYPTGLVLDDHAFAYRSIEVWEQEIQKGQYILLLVQPTFEVQRTTQEVWCEILAWISVGIIEPEYTQAYHIESCLDNLPYIWFDAPSSMPHLSFGWKAGGTTNWCMFGLDPGVPVVRPILPLCTA